MEDTNTMVHIAISVKILLILIYSMHVISVLLYVTFA